MPSLLPKGTTSMTLGPTLTAASRAFVEKQAKKRSVSFGPLIAAEEKMRAVSAEVERAFFTHAGDVRVYRYDKDYDPILKYDTLPCTESAVEQIGPRLDLFRRCQSVLSELVAIAPPRPLGDHYGYGARWCRDVAEVQQLAFWALGLNPRFLFPNTTQAVNWRRDRMDSHPDHFGENAQWVKGAHCYGLDDSDELCRGIDRVDQHMYADVFPRFLAMTESMSASFEAATGETEGAGAQEKQRVITSWIYPRFSGFVGYRYPIWTTSFAAWLPADLLACENGRFRDPFYALKWLDHPKRPNRDRPMWAAPKRLKDAHGGSFPRLAGANPENTWAEFFRLYKDSNADLIEARSKRGFRLASKCWGPSPVAQVEVCKALARDMIEMDGVEVFRRASAFWLNNHLRFFVSVMGAPHMTVEQLDQIAKDVEDQQWDNYKQFSIETTNVLGELVGGIVGILWQLAAIVGTPLLRWVGGGRIGPGLLPILEKMSSKYPQSLILRSIDNPECSTSTDSGFDKFLPEAQGSGLNTPPGQREDLFTEKPSKMPWVVGGGVAAALLGVIAFKKGLI